MKFQVHRNCDQNDSYEITINGFQVRKINEIINVIFGLRYGKPSSALTPKLGCSPKYFGEKPCLNNKGSLPKLTLRKVSHSGDRKLRFLFRLFF